MAVMRVVLSQRSSSSVSLGKTADPLKTHRRGLGARFPSRFREAPVTQAAAIRPQSHAADGQVTCDDFGTHFVAAPVAHSNLAVTDLSPRLLAHQRPPSTDGSAFESTDEFRPPQRSTPHMSLRPRTLSFAIEGPITRDDLPGLCDRVCHLLGSSDAEVAVCDVSGVQVDAVTVDALARLQLAARRHGCRIRLCGNASPELVELVEFMGLTNVLPCGS
jgi:ABC-type transporter Mla MlaB component